MSLALHVEDAGSGVPVILLHSSGMSSRQWRRLAATLVQRGYRAIVPDLSGHGRSPAWPESEPFDFQVDAAQIGALIAAQPEPVHLVGHSYGGFVAALAARAAPARVRSLVLYDPVAFGTLDPIADRDALDELAVLPITWEAVGRDAWLEAFVDYWSGRGAWRGLREDARAEFVRVAWPLYRGVVTLVEDHTPAEAYRVITAPVLLLTGERSTVAAHRVITRLAAVLHARRETIPGAGHMGPLTHSEAVNAAIVDWLTMLPLVA